MIRLNATLPRHAWVSYILELLYMNTCGWGFCHENAGAPRSIWTRLDVDVPAATTDTDSGAMKALRGPTASINVTVDLIGKVPTRHAEATFLRFTPPNT